jgi:polyhydroxyalkanoate synthesis regulator phasin
MRRNSIGSCPGFETCVCMVTFRVKFLRCVTDYLRVLFSIWLEGDFKMWALFALVKNFITTVLTGILNGLKSVFEFLGLPGIVGIIATILVLSYYQTNYVHPKLEKAAYDRGLLIGKEEEKAVWVALNKKAQEDAKLARQEATLVVANIVKQHQLNKAEIESQNQGLEESIRQYEKELEDSVKASEELQFKVETLTQELANVEENTSAPKTIIVKKVVNGKCTTVVNPILPTGIVRELNKIGAK